MPDIKIVIGASAGDEGKGLATNYFCSSVSKKKLVVLSNGGAQRGHTVELKNGTRHVFHHFGSGSFAGADTYIPAQFIINFMTYAAEIESLPIKTVVYVNPKCNWSTPFDMLINQQSTLSHSYNKRSSCGMGIWETVFRCHRQGFLSLGAFLAMDRETRYDYLISIRDKYFSCRIKEIGLRFSPEYKEMFYSDGIIQHFLDDTEIFKITTKLADNTILCQYSNIVFENGQGLLIGDTSKTNYDYSTPSLCGITNALDILKSVKMEENPVEACYVTRSYLTRHGAGILDGECDRAHISKNIFDRTNKPNPFQGNLRYGTLDIDKLGQRITSDFKESPKNWKLALMVTHTNECGYPGIRANETFDIVYTSNNPYTAKRIKK